MIHNKQIADKRTTNNKVTKKQQMTHNKQIANKRTTNNKETTNDT